jgi:hypothetical protein
MSDCEDCESSFENETSLTFKFLTAEEQPLLGTEKASILTIIAFCILSVGILLQARIYVILSKQKNEGTVAAIDKLFKVHNIVNMFCQPTFTVYLMFSFHFFPMVDYVGITGCAFLSHFLQVFFSIYCLIFPLTIAVVRYLFVVQSGWTKRYGMSELINTIVFLSLAVPLFMTISLQYPVSDYIHGPFNYCKGRFEVFFNPMHSDPITPGTVLIFSIMFLNLIQKFSKHIRSKLIFCIFMLSVSFKHSLLC